MIPRHLKITALVLLITVFAMATYIVRLQQRQKSNLRRASDSRPVTPAASGSPEKIKMVIAYDEDGILKEEDFNVRLPGEREQRLRELVRALLAEYLNRPSPHPLGGGADIRDAYLVNGTLAVLDMNLAFADAHPSGVRLEQFTLYSLSETLRDNFPEIKQMKILIDGKERETLAGHIDLMPIFDVNELHESAKELE